MSLCCFRSFLALLSGAGVLGGFPASALAGDKIEFSRASETLAEPKADRPDSEPPDAFSGFDFGNPEPETGIVYLPTPAPAPSRRNAGPNLQNGTGGLGSDKFGQDDSFERSPWQSYATNYSSGRDGIASNYLSAARAWETPENPDGLGGGVDRMDSRYGQADARVDSLNSLERRDRQVEFGSGAAGYRPWAYRREDASGSGAKTSFADLLKPENKSFFDANPDRFNPISQSADSRASRAWGSPSIFPADRSLTSPDSTEPGYNGYTDPSARAPSLNSGRGFGKQDEGNSTGLPAMRPYDDGLGLGYQAYQPAPTRKTPPSTTPGAPQPQKGGATLSKPRDPTSVFTQ